MNLIDSTPSLASMIKLEPNVQFVQYMAPEGLKYCDILLRVPLSSAEVHHNSALEEDPEIDEIFC